MVVAFELDHEFPPRDCAGKTDGRLRRLCSRIRKAQLLDPRYEVGNKLGRFAGEPMREGDVPADALDRLLDRVPDKRRRVTEEVDPVPHAVVDVGVAVEVANRRTSSLVDHELLAGPESGITRLAAGDVPRDLHEGGTRADSIGRGRGHAASLRCRRVGMSTTNVSQRAGRTSAGGWKRPGGVD